MIERRIVVKVSIIFIFVVRDLVFIRTPVPRSSIKFLPGLAFPPDLLKLAFIPESFGELDGRFRMHWHQYRNNIEAMRHLVYVKNSAINFRRANDLSLFSQVDVRDDRHELVRPPCLYLDNAQGLDIKCY